MEWHHVCCLIIGMVLGAALTVIGIGFLSNHHGDKGRSL
jgi:hypothetical protein